MDAGLNRSDEGLKLPIKPLEEFERVAIGGLHLLTCEVTRFLDTDLNIVVGLFDALGEAAFRFVRDFLAMRFRRLRDGVLFDEPSSLFFSSTDNDAGFFFGITDDAATVGDKFACFANFLGDGDSHLIDEVEQPTAINDDAVPERHFLRLVDQLFEAVDEVQEIHRELSLSPALGARTCLYPWLREAIFFVIASETFGGTSSLTSRPNPESSRTRLALMNMCSAAVIR